MLKALLKKQFLELLSVYYQSRKTGNRRSAAGIFVFCLLYAALFLGLGCLFFLLSDQLIGALWEQELEWLYFAAMGMMALGLGVLGSVFHTYAGLYHAADNDLLLAMPLPQSYILFARMTGVYAMGVFYELPVMVPAVLVYWLRMRPPAEVVIGSCLIVLLLGFAVLTLTCLLGFAVALITGKLKNRSSVTVLLWLIGLCGYGALYVYLYGFLKNILLYGDQMSGQIRSTAYPLYLLGMAAAGSGKALLLFAFMAVTLLAATYCVMACSFAAIAARADGTAMPARSRERYGKKRMETALLHREWRRFTASPTYMLGCGLGTVLMPLLSVAALLYGDTVRSWIDRLRQTETGRVLLVPALLCAVCLIASSNAMTAPSVSLEGKCLWQIRSLPVKTNRVLAAKLKLHLIVTLPPVLLFGGTLVYLARLPWEQAGLLLCGAAAYTVLHGAAGLALDLTMPTLTWTSESAPIKQGISVLLSVIGGWVVSLMALAIAYLLQDQITAEGYLTGFSAVAVPAALLVYAWLKQRGGEVFERL